MGQTLFANPFGGALDRLGIDGLFGQVVEEVATLREGDGIAAGIDDLAKQAGAVAAQVNPQTLGLREKKPCGKSCKWRRVRSR